MASSTYENFVHAFIESLTTEKGFSDHTGIAKSARSDVRIS
jgi:hypothetical protein